MSRPTYRPRPKFMTSRATVNTRWRLPSGDASADDSTPIRMPAGRASQLQPGAGVDNLPRVHRRSHRRVAARAGEVEQAQPFHEERPLFAEEDREALVDFDLELRRFRPD